MPEITQPQYQTSQEMKVRKKKAYVGHRISQEIKVSGRVWWTEGAEWLHQLQKLRFAFVLFCFVWNSLVLSNSAMTLGWSSQQGPVLSSRQDQDMTSWSTPSYILWSSFWLFLLHIVGVLQGNTGERLACGHRSRTCCCSPACLGTCSTWVWRHEVAVFKHDGDLRDNNYCILKHRNYSGQWKPVPGLSKHMFPWGGQRKAWGNRFRPEQWETRQNVWEHQKHNDHGAFTFWFRSRGHIKITILFTRLKLWLFTKSVLFVIGSSTCFPFSHTGYFLTDLLTVCFLGAKAVSSVTQPCSVTWALIHNWSF